jgi:hypothetical protein
LKHLKGWIVPGKINNELFRRIAFPRCIILDGFMLKEIV